MTIKKPASLGTLLREIRACAICAPVLPHLSPRTIARFKRNPWFEAEILPTLRERVFAALNDAGLTHRLPAK